MLTVKQAVKNVKEADPIWKGMTIFTATLTTLDAINGSLLGLLVGGPFTGLLAGMMVTGHARRDRLEAALKEGREKGWI